MKRIRVAILGIPRAALLYFCTALALRLSREYLRSALSVGEFRSLSLAGMPRIATRIRFMPAIPLFLFFVMDPSWEIKENEWSERAVSALRFFDELRVLFVREELVRKFPILLEHHLRRDMVARLNDTTLSTARADFHIQTIINYLNESPKGVFVIERHLPPDMEGDRAVMLAALENALDQQQ